MSIKTPVVQFVLIPNSIAMSFAFTLGVFYQINKQVYHNALYGDHNPIRNNMPREVRLDKIRKLIEP